MRAGPGGSDAGAVVGVAQEIMARRLGAPVKLEPLGAPRGGHAGVLRCALAAGSSVAAPATVILKHLPRHDGRPRAALLNEWAALRWLTRLGLDPPVCPRLYGGDLVGGVLVLEDLGDGERLADVLLAGDAARARAALVDLARALGRMQAASIARIDEYRRLRAGAGPPGGEAAIDAGVLADRFDEALRGVGLTADGAARRDVDAVVARIAQPGPFLAFVHGDACPGNERLAGEGVVLLDFATAGLRHALLDGVCGRVPFASCWCVRRLPDDVAAPMEERYRVELARGCAAARDDAAFAVEAATAIAYWVVETTTVALSPAPFRDRTWGTATIGQRLALRAGLFAELSDASGRFGALADLLARLVDVLGVADEQMPLYPAFGGPPVAPAPPGA